MGSPPQTPSRGMQTPTATLAPSRNVSPDSKQMVRLALKAWASNPEASLDRDSVQLILERGVDRICGLHNAIVTLGEEDVSKMFALLKTLPGEERSDLIDSVFDKRSAHESRSLSTPQPSRKRGFAELSPPSTYGSTSPHTTPSSSGKRIKTSSSSGGSSSGRTLRYCPKCNTSMKNNFLAHIDDHLPELCPSLSVSSRPIVIGCGYCYDRRRNKYYGKAFAGRDAFVQHIHLEHSLAPTDHGWDINNTINNILSHELFAGDYEDFGRERKLNPSTTSLTWTASPQTEKLLHELQVLGGRLSITTARHADPDYADQIKISELLDRAFALARVTTSTYMTPLSSIDQTSFMSRLMGVHSQSTDTMECIGDTADLLYHDFPSPLLEMETNEQLHD